MTVSFTFEGFVFINWYLSLLINFMCVLDKGSLPETTAVPLSNLFPEDQGRKGKKGKLDVIRGNFIHTLYLRKLTFRL